MSTQLLTEGKIGRTLLRFAIPFLMASLLQALYGAADLFVVGQFAGSASVSAVAIGSQVMQTVTGIVLEISMVRIPLSYGLSKMAGVTPYEIGFAAPTATALSLVICLGYFYYESKLQNKVARTF